MEPAHFAESVHQSGLLASMTVLHRYAVLVGRSNCCCCSCRRNVSRHCTLQARAWALLLTLPKTAAAVCAHLNCSTNKALARVLFAKHTYCEALARFSGVSQSPYLSAR
jgi:hypothetical protein